MMAKSFPKLEMDTNLQIQYTEQTTCRINPNKSMPRHIIIQFQKTKDQNS